MTKKIINDKTNEKKDKSIRINRWKTFKEQLAHQCIDDEQAIINMSVDIGDIFDCSIGENIGEEQSNNRPVLVVSKSLYNKNSGRVTVVPLSTNIRTKVVIKSGKPRTVLKVQTHHRLNKSKFNFLDDDSVVKCEQIKTVSKSRLTKKIGAIDDITLKRIQNKLKLLLDIQ